ncbi:MAG: hypothetical protein ABIG92_04360 [Candidatus Omnitrophota bacterium]
MKYLLVITLIFGVLFPSLAYSEDISQAFISDYESRDSVYVYKGTLKERSRYTSSIKRLDQNGRVYYKFTESGSGDYDKYKDISWESTARLEEVGGFLYTIYSTQTIKDKDGSIIIMHEKLFDYEKNKVEYIAKDFQGNIIKKQAFPIKDKTTDNISLVYFLRALIAHRGDKGYRSFYLISNEPRRYRINVKVIGEEALRLPGKEVTAIKLRLIPDMGILTGLSNALIPPTYVWHGKESPYMWLQYEGLESGLGSECIVTYVLDK